MGVRCWKLKLRTMADLSSLVGWCPVWAPGLGFLGAALALAFANMGAAYGTWKSYHGLSLLVQHVSSQKADGQRKGQLAYEQVIKSMLPIVMSGVCGIFGLIEAVVIVNNITSTGYTLFLASAHFAGGLCVGLANFASGYCM